MIEARQICKQFGGFVALDQVSFRVPKGEVAGFLGLNGAGKTTTLRILSSFTPPTTGSVSIAGFDTVRESQQVRRRIGYLPERVPLYDEMRVREYLRFRARLKGMSRKASQAAIDRVVDRCGLGVKENSIIGTLSKGYRQRVGLADALVHRPDLLILDEPTSGLDPDQRLEIRSLIQDLGQETTVMLSTHILPEAEAVCSRIIIIHAGMIRAEGSLADMRTTLEEVCVRYSGQPLPEHVSRATPEREGEVHTRINFKSSEEASRAVAAAVKAGRRVLEMSSSVPSLETIFMRITTGRDNP